MNKEELIKKLKEWNKTKTIKKGDKEILVFENEEVFKIFGREQDEVLNPFNNYTYEWLSDFFYDLLDFLEYCEEDVRNELKTLNELLEDFSDNIFEYADTRVDVYTSNLTEWLNDNPNNVYYLTEAREETEETDGFKLLQIAQFKAIGELYNNALSIIVDMVSE